MKKALMILMALTIVTVGAFAEDFHVGVNIKGTESPSYGDVSFGVEVGYTGDYVGVYGQVGVTDFNGLLGISLSMPEIPVQIYGGAGIAFRQQIVTITDTYNVIDGEHVGTGSTTETSQDNKWYVPNHTHEYQMFGGYNDHGIQQMTNVSSFSTNEAVPFFEAGVGLDMGPMLWKVGWSNLNGNAVSVTMAASI